MSENQVPNINIHEIPARLLYPSSEARVLLGGISESTFRRMTAGKGRFKDRPLKTKRIGAFVYVPRDDLVAAIAALPDA